MTALPANYPSSALIDGQWVASPKTFAVTDPATGEELARVPDLGADDARRAIDAASKAFPAWAAKTAKERGAILRRWFDLITAETESLARLMTAEQGKPLAESRGEVAYGASFVEWFAEEGKRAYGRTIPTTFASKRYITIKQPIGVAAASTWTVLTGPMPTSTNTAGSFSSTRAPSQCTVFALSMATEPARTG